MTPTKLSVASRSAMVILKGACQAVVRRPRPTFFVILILSVGIAATSVTFSVADAVIFKPLPYERSHEIVRVSGRNPAGPIGLSLNEIRALHNGAQAFESLGVARFGTSINFRVGDVADTGDVAFATTGYVQALRLTPIMGRMWSPEEEATAGEVATISYDVWRDKLGGDPKVLEKFLEIDDARYRIIGVMPLRSTHVDGSQIAAWVPAPEMRDKTTLSDRPGWYPIGRLRPGLSLSAAERQATLALAPYVSARPSAERDWKAEIRRLDSHLLGPAEGWLLPAFVAVITLLLITCLNGASFLLARSHDRVGEFAVRASLGATRAQLALGVFIETILLSAAACVAALLISYWGVTAIKPLLPQMFRSDSIVFDGRVFVASVFIALIAGGLCGVVPAWRASQTTSLVLLRESRSISASRKRWQEAFLIGEIASVAVVLTVSALFVLSFVRVLTRDMGFGRTNLLAVSTVTDYKGTVEDVATQFANIPGIDGVAAVAGGSPPLVGSAFGGAYRTYQLEAFDGGSAAPPISADTYFVSANFFQVATIPFLRGRPWNADAVGDVVIIDAVTARALFGDGDPIGRRVAIARLRGDGFTVVGVIPRQYARGPERERPTAYIPLSPRSRPSWVGFLLRTSREPQSLVQDVERVYASIAPPDPSPGAGVHVVADAFRQLTARRRFTAQLMMVFGIVAVVIAAAGMYAVIYSTVKQQVREFAIRMAIGATPANIWASVLIRSLKLLTIGLSIGLLVGWGVSRWFESMLFMVTGADPLVYGAVATTLSLIGLSAAMLPAWHASRVDPNRILQHGGAA